MGVISSEGLFQGEALKSSPDEGVCEGDGPSSGGGAVDAVGGSAEQCKAVVTGEGDGGGKGEFLVSAPYPIAHDVDGGLATADNAGGCSEGHIGPAHFKQALGQSPTHGGSLTRQAGVQDHGVEPEVAGFIGASGEEMAIVGEENGIRAAEGRVAGLGSLLFEAVGASFQVRTDGKRDFVEAFVATHHGQGLGEAAGVGYGGA